MRIIASFAMTVLVLSPLAAQTPNHREGAPFRAKLSPPHAKGEALVVSGRVTDSKTGEGVAHAVLDAFQADADGHYDSEGFEYRARILTDEQGHFEFETIVPSNYGPVPHIHFYVTADGYKDLRTDMYFRDDEHPEGGPPELTPNLVERTAKNGKAYLEARFDVTLESAR